MLDLTFGCEGKVVNTHQKDFDSTTLTTCPFGPSNSRWTHGRCWRNLPVVLLCFMILSFSLAGRAEPSLGVSPIVQENIYNELK